MKFIFISLTVAIFGTSSVYTASSNTLKKTQTTVKTTTRVNKNKKTVTQPKTGLTKKASCDPNYSGCVPIASDVDCLGGKGDGPVYVKGPVRVIGRDVYGLDRDKNGIGCE